MEGGLRSRGSDPLLPATACLHDGPRLMQRWGCFMSATAPVPRQTLDRRVVLGFLLVLAGAFALTMFLTLRGDDTSLTPPAVGSEKSQTVNRDYSHAREHLAQKDYSNAREHLAQAPR